MSREIFVLSVVVSTRCSLGDCQPLSTEWISLYVPFPLCSSRYKHIVRTWQCLSLLFKPYENQWTDLSSSVTAGTAIVKLFSFKLKYFMTYVRILQARALPYVSLMSAKSKDSNLNTIENNSLLPINGLFSEKQLLGNRLAISRVLYRIKRFCTVVVLNKRIF